MAWTYVPCDSPAGGPSPWSRACVEWIKARGFVPVSVGIYARRRNTANPDEWSVHACGRAVDWFPRSREEGWRLWFELIDSGSLDLQMVIWDRFVWGGARGPGVRRYTGPNPHTDHLHIESRSWTAA